MFLIWHENLLSYDNMRLFFFARSGGKRDVIFYEKNIHKILLDLLGDQLGGPGIPAKNAWGARKAP